MISRPVLVAALLIAAVPSMAHADPALVMHAGEWESTMTAGGPKTAPRRICERTDRAFDQATVSRMMANTGGAKCGPIDIRTTGGVATYSTACEVAGGHMTLHGTITTDGPDAFTSRTQSHFEGGAMKLPDMEMVNVSRRLGPCQPGDTESRF